MRRARRKRLEAIYTTVEQNPGIRAGRVARKLGVPRSAVSRALPAMEEAGLLLSEDRKGGLRPWRRR